MFLDIILPEDLVDQLTDFISADVYHHMCSVLNQVVISHLSVGQGMILVSMYMDNTIVIALLIPVNDHIYSSFEIGRIFGFNH